MILIIKCRTDLVVSKIVLSFVCFNEFFSNKKIWQCVFELLHRLSRTMTVLMQ